MPWVGEAVILPLQNGRALNSNTNYLHCIKKIKLLSAKTTQTRRNLQHGNPKIQNKQFLHFFSLLTSPNASLGCWENRGKHQKKINPKGTSK